MSPFCWYFSHPTKKKLSLLPRKEAKRENREMNAFNALNNRREEIE
jgi:hypothetical protein